MKNTLLLIGLLIFSMYGCQTTTPEITIQGQIIGDIPETLEHNLPISGVCFWGFKSSVPVDSTGKFRFNLSIEEPSFVRLWNHDQKIKAGLVIEPGQTYQIIFDQEKDTLHIQSKDVEGQLAYNKLPMVYFFQSEARPFMKDLAGEEIKLAIKKAKQNDLQVFDQLRNDGKISEGFYQLISSDRQCYYASLQGTIALLKYYEDKNKDTGAFSEDIQTMWKEVFEEYPLEKNDMFRSMYFYDLVSNYINFKTSTDKKVQEAISDIDLWHLKNMAVAQQVLSADVQEFYQSAYIYYRAVQKKFEQELVTVFNEFDSIYPESSFTRYVAPELEPIIAFHKKKNKPFSQEVYFVEGYENFNSLEESLTPLAGKKLYIDIWATWCGPCKQEFKYKEALYALLDQYQAEILYISIDDDTRDQQWKDMIKYYDLKGYHLRTSTEALETDLRNIYDQNGMIMIPWYLLIDEKGNIEKKHAPKPSQLEKLEQLLEEGPEALS
ncbi:MAG: redoxin family protein [Candidatus Cyclobacteriaceae bacterium M3_2C_046]